MKDDYLAQSMADHERLVHLTGLVTSLRIAQRRSAKSKEAAHVRETKDWERRVDQWLDQFERAPSLFGDGEGGGA